MNTPELSIILPVVNEADIIKPVVLEIEKVLVPLNIDYEIILVENESTDHTWTVLKEMEEKNKRIRAVKTKQGYGSAVLCGIRNARNKYVCYMPSDGQIDPDILPRLWQEIGNGSYDVVKIKRANRESILRWIQSKTFNLIARTVYGIRIRDINGSPRIVALDSLRKLHLISTDSFIDTEFAIKAHHLGWKIREIPMTNLPRVGGVSTVHVGTIVEFLRHLVSYRFSPNLAEWKRSQPQHIE